MVPLELLTIGEEGRVVDVHGPPETVVRLAEMGIRPGCWVRMIRSGSPSILAVDNHRFSYRAPEGTSVLVEVLPAGAPTSSGAV